MVGVYMGKFIDVDNKTAFLLPPSVDDWLPEDHLARFVEEIVEKLDFSAIEGTYVGCGKDAYRPQMLASLLFYGYATGVFSSRKMEQATYDSVAFRYLAGNTHPDHDTIANFRKKFLKEIRQLFTDILRIAHEMGVLKLGRVSIDGTKLHANASKHSALSYKHACELEKKLKAEIEELLKKAEDADASDLPNDLDIPEELKRREVRVARIQEAISEIERRSEERYEQEKREYDEKMKKREARANAGKKPRGVAPMPPTPTPMDKDQVNLTDPDSRIMKTSGGGFEQCYNAQAVVDVESKLIVSSYVTNHTNDKQEIEPSIQELQSLPQEFGRVRSILADTGYYSEANVELCEFAGIKPFICMSRDKHNTWLQKQTTPLMPLSVNAGIVERMEHRLKSRRGRIIYGKRKTTSEPVFGGIKRGMGFRQFLLRGDEAAGGEWDIVASAWNIRRMYSLKNIKRG